jgi:hypothetical protein
MGLNGLNNLMRVLDMIEGSPGDQIYLPNEVPIVLVVCWLCSPKQDQNKTVRQPKSIFDHQKSQGPNFHGPKFGQNGPKHLIKTPETSRDCVNFILDPHSELI